METKKSWIIASICFIIFILITILVITNHISPFDNLIYQLVYQNHNQYSDFFYTHFTHIGDTIPVICIAVVLLLILRKWKDRINLASCLALTVAINQILKHLIARPRPPLERRLIHQGGYSYPSGHSMAALCVYGVLIYFCQTKIKNKKIRIALTTLLTILILMIGISRIYVGVHYPSDVLGGYLLTIVILIIDITVVNNHFKGE